MNDSKKTKKQLAADMSTLEDVLVQLEVLRSKCAHAEEEKNELKGFWEDIFNTTVDGIIVTDENGTITMVNQAVENMLGYSHDELIGMNTIKFRAPGEEYEKKGAAFITKLLEEGIIRGWGMEMGSHFHMSLFKFHQVSSLSISAAAYSLQAAFLHALPSR